MRIHPELVKKRKVAFLAAYSDTGSVKLASDASGVSKSTHVFWLRNDESYRASFTRTLNLRGHGATIERPCEACGTVVSYSRSTVERRPSLGKYCSLKCSGTKTIGQLPANFRDGPIVHGGHLMVYVGHDHPRANSAGRVFEHIIIVEKALGRYLPEAHPVHHFNEVGTDNRNSNLVVCENAAYHRLLHSRQRIVAAGGDADLDKICSRCERLLPRTEFSNSSNRYDGLNPSCRRCTSLTEKGHARKIQQSVPNMFEADQPGR